MSVPKIPNAKAVAIAVGGFVIFYELDLFYTVLLFFHKAEDCCKVSLKRSFQPYVVYCVF